MSLQEKPFTHAYFLNGEPKFEELCVIFAPAYVQLIELSSNDDTAHSNSVIVLSSTDTAAQDDNRLAVVSANHDDSSHYDVGALMELEHVGDEVMQGGEAWNDGLHAVAMADIANVPFRVESPIHAVPLQVIPPLDMMEISSGSSHSTTLHNWWDYINVSFEDSEGSSATDLSTGHSVNTGRNNGHRTPMRKKKNGRKEDSGRGTSTSSN